MIVNAIIYATNSYGTSNPSNYSTEANITILVPPVTPATPVATNVGSNITISWTPP